MSPARGPRRRRLAAAAIIGLAGLAGAARADESADRGISLSAWAGGALDRSAVAADGRRARAEALVAGLTGIGNIERVAIGGAVDARPDVDGEGWLSIGALLGYQQEVGRDRLLLLGEGGGRRFSGLGGDPFARQLGPDPWLPFVGVRLSAARTVPAHGFVELGTLLFARYDLGRATITTVGSRLGETRADVQAGGFTAGLALQVGLRLESPHPWNQGVVEW